MVLAHSHGMSFLFEKLIDFQGENLLLMKEILEILKEIKMDKREKKKKFNKEGMKYSKIR